MVLDIIWNISFYGGFLFVYDEHNLLWIMIHSVFWNTDKHSRKSFTIDKKFFL